MRPIAEYVMRGRMQATLLIGIAAAIPMLFWLSAAAASLVLMRKGVAQAVPVIAWTLVPAAVWVYYGEPYVLLVIGSTLVLAYVLRATSSWLKVLLFSIVVGYGCVLGLQVSFAEQIATQANMAGEELPRILAGVYEQLSPSEQSQLHALLTPVLTGMMAAIVQMMSLLSLALGRYWQASLFNPGGFAREFHVIRLPFGLAMVLLLGMLLAPSIANSAAALTPLCAVPLGIAGVALIHGLVAKHKLGHFWLVAFYVGMVFFAYLLYPFLLLVIMVLADSLFDFRGLKASKSDAD